jgi:hypothetical protein
MISLRLGTQVTSEGNPPVAPPTRAQCSVKKTAAELKAIDEIRQLNKKKINEEQKKEEEEAKHQKDEEEARKKAEEDLARGKEEENVSKNLRNIMSGIDGGEDIMEIDGVENNNKDKRSSLKKRGGSSKTTTRCTSGKTHKIVSPQDQPQ